MCRFFVFLLLFANGLSAQSQYSVRCQILDSVTKLPVPFANVAVEGKPMGTTSDINGMFTLEVPNVNENIQISCIGYHSVTKPFAWLQNTSVIVLDTKPYDLSQIDVYPSRNLALEVMEKVLRHRNANNPDEATDYQCTVYHKMTFRYVTPDSLPAPKKALSQGKIDPRLQDLILIESVSEKKHLRPGKFSEKLITGRVSGLKDPVLAILPAQIQPFVFYNDKLELIGMEFINPISPQGLKQYVFVLEDTLFDSRGDTLLYISFSPRKNANIHGVAGTMHVHSATWGVKNVSATTMANGVPYVLSIKQTYSRVNEKTWFPEQLESSLRINVLAGGTKLPYPMLAEGKSYVTAVDLSPRFAPNEFSSTVLRDESYKKNAPSVESYRYEPLSRSDSLTYSVIDSLGRKANLDKMVQFQKNLLYGYIPVGPMKLDYRKLVDYSSFQGWKFGFGLYTGEAVSKRFETGGYFVRALGLDENLFGGSFTLNIVPAREAKLSVDWRDDYAETGAYAFLDGVKPLSPESFRKYMAESMDRGTEWRVGIESRLGGGWKARAVWSAYDKEPRIPYRYAETTDVAAAFSGHEALLQLRWRPGETYVWSPLGLFANTTGGPVFWGNFGRGEIDGPSTLRYYKVEGQAEAKAKVSPSQTTTLRLTAAQLWGDYNTTLLYSAFGTYKHVGIEVPHSFGTMRMNEFAADRFFIVSMMHEWAFNLNRQGAFKPRLVFSSKAGWGEVENRTLSTSYPIRSFPKGYFESGVALHNLLRQSIFRYGLGAHWRYGAYQHSSAMDNLTLTIVVELSLQ